MVLKNFNTKETDLCALQQIINLCVGGVISLNWGGNSYFYPVHSVDSQKEERTRIAATWNMSAAKHS